MTTAAAPLGAVDPRYRPPVGHLPRPGTAILRDTPRQQAQQLEALRWARILRAREDFRAFVEYALVDAETGGPVDVQWFQEEWVDAIDQHRMVSIVAPRAHGKSTLILARVVWELGRNPNLRVKIACEDQPAAVKRLSEIKQHIERNPRVREVFPGLLPSEPWSRTQATVRRTLIDKDPSIEAQGVLGGATGGRCDLLIGDDVVGRRNALTTPALRVAVKQAWYTDWLNLAGRSSRVWMIGTLYHKDDLTHEVRANAEWSHVFHAISEYNSIWPAGRPESWLRTRRALIGAIEYARGFANRPQDESESPIDPGSVEFVSSEALPPLEELEVYTSYDVATETTERHDFTTEVVLGIHYASEIVFVLDAEERKVRRARQSGWVFSSWRRWRARRILIESIGNDLAEWVLEDYPELVGVVERIRNLRTRGGKLQRLTGVSPFFDRGQVVFLDHLDPNSPKFDASRGNIVGQLLDFGISDHDDLVDALVNGLDAVRYYSLDRWGARRGTLNARPAPAAPREADRHEQEAWNDPDFA